MNRMEQLHYHIYKDTSRVVWNKVRNLSNHRLYWNLKTGVGYTIMSDPIFSRSVTHGNYITLGFRPANMRIRGQIVTTGGSPIY